MHLFSQELAALSQLLHLANQLDVRRIIARFALEVISMWCDDDDDDDDDDADDDDGGWW